MAVGGFGANSDILCSMATNVNYVFNDTWSAVFGYRLLDIGHDGRVVGLRAVAGLFHDVHRRQHVSRMPRVRGATAPTDMDT